jgi:hypothetical protein
VTDTALPRPAAADPAPTAPATPDHWFGGASGGRLVVGGLVGSSGAVAWFASASIIIGLVAAVLVVVAALAVLVGL